ncbi:MAG: gluconate 2-dehydrogenase subunit 3 family protein [Acidimicrobiia bacterium]|nr:gluconate 2-dehydrogenase subunit 3 family protein [Acidimicrobiia bacterium]
MNRRDLLRTIALGSAGLRSQNATANPMEVAARENLHRQHLSPKTPHWQPRFFSETQNETVTVIAELIIPETETPGARAAKVNEQIDRVLHEESAEIQQRFLKGLEWIDRKSREQFGADFRKVGAEQQTSILASLATAGGTASQDEIGRRFFEDIKRRTTFAYYTSEIGIHQELNYKGNAVLSEWPGCPHPGHHGDSDHR